MKARRKGTNEPFQKVASVCLCSGGYILIKDVEFEQEPNTLDHWQDVRERAAIAIAPQCLKIVQDVLFRGGAINEETVAKQVAVNAVEYADALVEKLKGE